MHGKQYTSVLFVLVGHAVNTSKTKCLLMNNKQMNERLMKSKTCRCLMSFHRQHWDMLNYALEKKNKLWTWPSEHMFNSFIGDKLAGSLMIICAETGQTTVN